MEHCTHFIVSQFNRELSTTSIYTPHLPQDSWTSFSQRAMLSLMPTVSCFPTSTTYTCLHAIDTLCALIITQINSKDCRLCPASGEEKLACNDNHEANGYRTIVETGSGCNSGLSSSKGMLLAVLLATHFIGYVALAFSGYCYGYRA